MRLSTANTFDASVDALARRQVDLGRAQEKLSSLKRVNRGSDDPTAAARAERARAGIERTQASQRAVEASRGAMTQAESALGEANDLLQHARETLVASGNGAYSDAERKALASELRNVRAQLLTIANRDDGAGSYLFGGQGSSAPPFLDAPGGVRFDGSPGETLVAEADRLPLSADGQAAFLQARTGNGVFETQAVTSAGGAWVDTGRVTQPGAVTGSDYSIRFSVVAGAGTTYSLFKDNVAMAGLAGLAFVPGQAIEVDGQAVTVNGQPADGDRFDMVPSQDSLSSFQVLEQLATQLETPQRSQGQVAQTTVFGLRDLDGMLARLQAVRSHTGEALGRIDSATGRLQTQELSQTAERSNAEDLDMVHAISEFQSKQTSYDAALKAYAMVQRLSLFQYLNP